MGSPDSLENNQVNLYRNLCEFQLAGRYLNFNKVAKKLFISRSAVSRHMAELEQYMGVELFVHNSNSIELTTSGKYLLDRSFSLIEKIDGLRDELNDLNVSEDLRLQLYGAAMYFPNFFNSIRAFGENNPDIKISTQSASLQGLIELLEKNQCDAILTFDFTTWGMQMRGFKKEILCHSSFALLMSQNHPLSKKEVITSKDLSQYEIMTSVPPEQLSRYLFTIQLEQGSTINHPTPLEFSDPISLYTILLQINTSKSVALLPESVAMFINEGCTIKRISDLEFPYDIILLYKTSNRNPALKMFFDEELKRKFPCKLD